jgi:hypothetical protein
MNNVITNVTTALKALLGGSSLDNQAALAVESFVGQFGQQAADHVAALDKNETLKSAEKLSDLASNVLTWAENAGWNVTKGFATTFGQAVWTVVSGASAPTTAAPSAATT